MNIQNSLPLLMDCANRWERKPGLDLFLKDYFLKLGPKALEVFGESGDWLFSALEGLNWPVYRAETLKLSVDREEQRVRGHLKRVEELFGLTLEGEILLFGAFTAMDGYARFDRGGHHVFLGVDESHGRGAYLDVLITHELTHVVRESREEVWTGFGLNPKMTQAEFTENLPVVEHLMNEGFSCVVSEILVPGEDPWNYAYQSRDSLAKVLERGPAVDAMVKKELAHPDGDYGRLYNTANYGRGMPQFCHYVWAWQWAKRVLKEKAGGDAKRLASMCSKDLIPHALAFQLEKIE